MRTEHKERNAKKEFHSESYALHQEIKKVSKELEKIKQEQKNRTRKDRRTSSILLWIVIALLFASLIISTIESINRAESETLTSASGTITETAETQGITITNESSIVQTEIEKADSTDKENSSERYYGVVLTGLAPLKYEYHTDEEAEIEATIEQNKTKETEMKINYQLTDQKGKTIYNYTDKITIKQKKNTLRKKILLTENYKTGKYTIKFKATFKQKNKQYALLGKTGFNIIKKPKKPLKARPEKTTTQLNKILQLLLFIALALNMAIAYKSWKIEKYD